MADIDSNDENANFVIDPDIKGFYQRFSLSDSKPNSFSHLLPSSCDNDESLADIKQPWFCSVNLTDSVCSSNNTISSNYNGYLISSDKLGVSDNSLGNDVNDLCGEKILISNEVIHDSEPEDMQDLNSSKPNEFVPDQTSIALNCILGNNDIQNGTSEKFFDPSFIECCKIFTSSPLSSMCVNKKMMSLSLQDVSTIEIFPLQSKTTNAFSTETIQTQSLSSTIKSKDSGFQRSASCLSLNSGNKSYDHVTSKVKQYINSIKESEAQRKKQKQSRVSDLPDASKSSVENKDVVVSVLSNTSNEQNSMINMISQLKDELKEKDTTLKELQCNYNKLLERYAEAINKIDLLRLRTSYSYDYYSDFNSDANLNNYNGNDTSLFLNCSRNRASSLSNNTNHNYENIFVNASNTVPQNVSLEPNVSKSSFDNNHNNSESSVKALSLSTLQRVPFNNNNNKNITLNFNTYSNDYKDVSIEKNKTRNSNDNHVNGNKSEEECLKLMSLTEMQRSQSSSHSTSLNTFSSVKNVRLGPINRMYSSSSRLDRKVSPLPSASSSVVDAVKVNDSKNHTMNGVNKNRANESYTNKHSSNSFDCNSNFYYPKNINFKESIGKKGNGALLIDESDSNVHYLNCQSISKLELPKVDPFDKVKKWQASLPTISLVRSHSSSSIGSSENDMKSHFGRCASLDAKLDDESLYTSSLYKFKTDRKKRRDPKSKMELKFQNSHNDGLNSSSKRNLKLSSKCPGVYPDIYYTGKHVSNKTTDEQTKNIDGRIKNSKRVLQRCDAVDLNNGQVVDSCNMSQNNFVNISKKDELLLNKSEGVDEDPCVLDESSSLSSSILSSTKDTSGNNNFDQAIEDTNKIDKAGCCVKSEKSSSNQNPGSGEANKEYAWQVVSPKCSDIKSVTRSQTGFSFSAQFHVNSNELVSEICPVNKIYAWGSLNHEDGSLHCDSGSSNSVVNSASRHKNLKSLNTDTKCYNKFSAVVKHKRKEKLKQYTNILNNIECLDTKKSISVGVQATNEQDEVHENCAIKCKVSTGSRSLNQHLEEVEEYIKYAIKEVGRIQNQLQGLQTCLRKPVNDENVS